MANSRKARRKSGTPKGGRVLWIILALMLVLAVGFGLGMLLWSKGGLQPGTESTGAAVITTPAAEKTDKPAGSGETEKTTAAKKTEADDQKTEKTTEAQQQTTVQTTAAAEDRFPRQEMEQYPLNQLISVVGWATADVRPDGFHSKHVNDKDMAALAASAMTLAAQGQLGLELNLAPTDDPDQAMLPADEVDALLALLVNGGKLTATGPMGTLVPSGTGWAVTLPDEDINLPITAVLDEEAMEGGQLLTVALLLATDRGETVLQTAMVEALRISGGFGYKVDSWTTQDEVRFSRSDGEGSILLSMGSEQRVLALELHWGDVAGEAVIHAGEETIAADPGDGGKSQVVLLNNPASLTEITIAVDDPAALKQIKIY